MREGGLSWEEDTRLILITSICDAFERAGMEWHGVTNGKISGSPLKASDELHMSAKKGYPVAT